VLGEVDAVQHVHEYAAAGSGRVVPPLRAVPGRAGESTTPSMSTLTVRTSPSSPDLITSRRRDRLLNDAEQQEMLVCVDEELEQRRGRRAPRPR
jgi:hypothetical protein